MTNLNQTTEENQFIPTELIEDSKYSKQPRLKIWILLFAVFYVVTAIPAGFFVYSIKNSAGIDIFKKGGGHAFARCIEQAFNPKNLNISN